MSHLVVNLEDRLARDEAHINVNSGQVVAFSKASDGSAETKGV